MHTLQVVKLALHECSTARSHTWQFLQEPYDDDVEAKVRDCELWMYLRGLPREARLQPYALRTPVVTFPVFEEIQGNFAEHLLPLDWPKLGEHLVVDQYMMSLHPFVSPDAAS